MARLDKRDRQSEPRFDRREALKLAVLGGTSFAMSGVLGACAEVEDDVIDGTVGELGRPRAPLFVGGLTTSLPKEQCYTARIEGRLPRELRGTLYKNGPGLFERAGVRKRTLLDGDGMISAYRFERGRVQFQNRFVRTPKYMEEEQAGRYLYDGWTTPINDPPATGSDQASVTVWPWSDRLYAFDEGERPWILDPQDLSTVEPTTFGLPPGQAALFAHGKQLPGSGQFTLFGVDYGTLNYNYLVLDEAHRVLARHSFPVTTYGPPAYMHDWFVTPRHFVLHIMPALIDGAAIARGSVLRDALGWEPSLPSRLLVFRRDAPAEAPRIFEMDATWMWHTANAHERGDGELVLDWIGHDDPYHFVGRGAEWETIMSGELRPTGAGGIWRRTVLDLKAGSIATHRYRERVDQEFPYVAPGRLGQRYRYMYLVYGKGASVLYQHVAKIDVESGRSDSFDFGPGRYALEPVFAPRPGARAEDDGFLLVEFADERTGRAALAVFDARRLSDGPLATVQLRHHIPMRFHGRWAPS